MKETFRQLYKFVNFESYFSFIIGYMVLPLTSHTFLESCSEIKMAFIKPFEAPQRSVKIKV